MIASTRRSGFMITLAAKEGYRRLREGGRLDGGRSLNRGLPLLLWPFWPLRISNRGPLGNIGHHHRRPMEACLRLQPGGALPARARVLWGLPGGSCIRRFLPPASWGWAASGWGCSLLDLILETEEQRPGAKAGFERL